MGDTTPSGTKGNASAQVNAGTAPVPLDKKFELELTPEEVALHFQNNENIIAIAERIDAIKIDAATMIERVKNRGSLLFAYAGEDQSNSAAIRHFSEEADAAIAREVQKIENEISAVKTEFRALAEALNDGRQNYINAVEVWSAPLSEDLSVYMGGAPMMSAAHSIMDGYERTYASYLSLKDGFSYETNKEMLISIGKGIASFVVETVVTSMVASPIAAAGARLAKIGKLAYGAVRALPRVQAMAMRLKRLSSSTRKLLDDIAAKFKPKRPKTDGANGTAGQAPKPTAPKPKPQCIRCVGK